MTNTQAPALAKLPGTNGNGPDGRRFSWGPIQKVHTIGRYEIVEHLRDGSNYHRDDPEGPRVHGSLMFHPYIDGRDTNHSYPTIEGAMVGAVAIALDGINTRADVYFARMVGIGEDR